ncbi:PrsW family intramembrane metalloprotease [Brooklawnia cerclae]|uniref:RsiW-degrading membrane proteinase PrsW (M82 family) n=1 Tax=Brooklawnia cerclae TaxID=349934 RepID=A0ABX0SIN6_9ACTN|nr:PrsW family intramembrane metalloprotease [Brooklawnia cerclae]NIH58257.1 RsiW-degrading membrane proteinase PrsW (M82 family) [Brooklawnia cerclae]
MTYGTPGFAAPNAPVAFADERSWPRRLLWLLVLVGGVVAYVVVLFALVQTENLNLFPALLLIGSVTVPAATLVFAEDGGAAPTAPVGIVVFAAIVGGVIGILAASILEYDTLRGLGSVPMIFVGLIEEAAKLIVPLALYLLWRPRDPRGGIVIGVASGMGFAALETMGYGFQALLSARSLAAVDDTLLLRALLSPACHIAWTGMSVAMLWRIRTSPNKGRAVLAFVATFLAAAILHALWDASTSIAVHGVIAIIGVVVLLTFIRRAHRRQLRAVDFGYPDAGSSPFPGAGGRPI